MAKQEQLKLADATPIPTKAEWVVERLRDAIVAGDLKPGARLLQDVLAEQFNVSYTPIREALRRLEAEGLVKSEPHKGVQVTSRETQDRHTLYELFRIRSALEALAVETAVPHLSSEQIEGLWNLLQQIDQHMDDGQIEPIKRLNYEFHRTFCAAAGAPTLYALITTLWARFPWDILLTAPNRAESSAQEHRQIVEAAAAHDAHAASEAMRNHICHGGELALRYLGTNEPSNSS